MINYCIQCQCDRMNLWCVTDDADNDNGSKDKDDVNDDDHSLTSHEEFKIGGLLLLPLQTWY